MKAASNTTTATSAKDFTSHYLIKERLIPIVPRRRMRNMVTTLLFYSWPWGKGEIRGVIIIFNDIYLSEHLRKIKYGFLESWNQVSGGRAGSNRFSNTRD